MSEEDFLKKYNLKRAENTEDYQIDNETIIKELKERIDKANEYIKENADDNCTLNFAEELLDILKGNIVYEERKNKNE